MRSPLGTLRYPHSQRLGESMRVHSLLCPALLALLAACDARNEPADTGAGMSRRLLKFEWRLLRPNTKIRVGLFKGTGGATNAKE